jgi:hypothetical protein
MGTPTGAPCKRSAKRLHKNLYEGNKLIINFDMERGCMQVEGDAKRTTHDMM